MELDFSKNIKSSKELNSLFALRQNQAYVNELSDNDFAYIELGGKKDHDDNTVPRSLRHFPIATEKDIDESLAKLNSSNLLDSIKQEVLKKIEAKAKKMGYNFKDKKGNSEKSDEKKEDSKKEDSKKEDSSKKESSKKSDEKKSLEKTTAPMNCPECY